MGGKYQIGGERPQLPSRGPSGGCLKLEYGICRWKAYGHLLVSRECTGECMCRDIENPKRSTTEADSQLPFCVFDIARL